jgi:hypothetical protein
MTMPAQDEVTVVNADSWLPRTAQLAGRASNSSRQRQTWIRGCRDCGIGTRTYGQLREPVRWVPPVAFGVDTRGRSAGETITAWWQTSPA